MKQQTREWLKTLAEVKNNSKAIELLDYIKKLEEVVKAVDHVGVDFGYGKYELQPDDIDKARTLYEIAISHGNLE